VRIANDKGRPGVTTFLHQANLTQIETAFQLFNGSMAIEAMRAKNWTNIAFERQFFATRDI
jgi:hypothetical protein